MNWYNLSASTSWLGRRRPAKLAGVSYRPSGRGRPLCCLNTAKHKNEGCCCLATISMIATQHLVVEIIFSRPHITPALSFHDPVLHAFSPRPSHPLLLVRLRLTTALNGGQFFLTEVDKWVLMNSSARKKMPIPPECVSMLPVMCYLGLNIIHIGWVI